MIDIILSKLDKVKGNGTKYRAKCPVRHHSSGDSTLSLLFNTDGRILIHCHGGCEANDVLESIGLSLSDLYPDGAIRDFMATAAVKKPTNNAITVMEIANDMRASGKRLTQKELQEERQAYLRSRK